MNSDDSQDELDSLSAPSATTDIDFQKVTIPQLRALLQQHNVRVPSAARKAVLVEMAEELVERLRRDRTTQGVARPAAASSSPKRKPRQTAPPATMNSSSSSSAVFSDDNPFQRGGSSSTGRTSRKSVPSTRPDKDHVASSPAAPAKTSPKSNINSSPYRNYMDPSVAKSTPPRVLEKVGSAARRAIERFSPAPKSEEEQSEEDGSALEQLEEEEEEDDGDDDDDDIKKESEEDDTTPRIITPKRRPTRAYPSPPAKVRTKDTTSAKTTSTSILWSTLILVLFAWSSWYVRETKTIGFCDTGSASNHLLRTRQQELDLAHERAARLAASEDSDLFSALPPLRLPDEVRPTCVPCPPHSLCDEGALQRCSSPDHILSPALTARIPLLRSLLPLAAVRPSCVPDGTKLILAAELGDEVQRVLSDWRGAVLCHHAQPHHDARTANGRRLLTSDVALEHDARRYALPEAALRDDLAAQRDRSIVDDAYFAQLWHIALDELERRGAIVRVHVPGVLLEGAHGSDDEAASIPAPPSADLLLSTDARVPLTCRARLSFASFLRRTRLYVVALAALAATLLYGRARWRSARSDAVRVRELVQLAYERLQEQEYLHALDPVLTPEAYVPTAHLRDHVLRTEPSAAARKRLWARVARQVEENANVRTRQAQRRGEWMRVWEWVGLVGAEMARARLEGEGGERRKGAEKTGAREAREAPHVNEEQEQVMVEKKRR